MLFFPEKSESERFFSDVNFWSKSDFSIKIELKNWVSGKYFFSRIWLFEMFCIRNLPERKILNSKPDLLEKFLSNFHCAGKLLLQNLIIFLLKISFQTLIFNEKGSYKVMPFKMSTKMNNLLFWAEQIESKHYFLDVMFLSKSDPQWKLNSKSNFRKKILSPQNDYWKKFFRNPPGRKTLDSKTDHFVGKNFISKFEFFFRKIRFKLWFSMKKFATKSCLLKWARKVKNLLSSAEEIKSKRYFLDVMFWSKSDSSIKIELKI